MRQLSVIVAALAAATFETHAGNLDWVFDVPNNDEIARGQAQFLVWDGVSRPPRAAFEKIEIVDKDWPFYLFHVVLSSPGKGGERDRSSYLVCFKLAEIYNRIPNTYRDSIRLRPADRTGDHDR